MRKFINVAELVITGSHNLIMNVPEARYSNPYVEINVSEDEEISITLNQLEGDVVLCVPFKFREATTWHDYPTFKARISDSDGSLLDEIVVSNTNITFAGSIDIIKTWQFFDNEFRFMIESKDIPIGAGVDPLTLIFDFEVKLYSWQWRPIPDTEVIPDEIREQSSARVKVHIKALSLKDFCVDSCWPKGDHEYGYNCLYTHATNYKYDTHFIHEPLTMINIRDEDEFIEGLQDIKYWHGLHGFGVNMGTAYNIPFYFKNNSTKTITSFRIVIVEILTYNNRFIQEAIDYYENKGTGVFPDYSNFEPTEYEFDKIVEIGPGETYTYYPPSFTKEWDWFDVKELDWVQDLFGFVNFDDVVDLKKTKELFIYFPKIITLNFSDGTHSDIDKPERIAFGRYQVGVPREKLDAIYEYAHTIKNQEQFSFAGLVLAILGVGIGCLTGQAWLVVGAIVGGGSVVFDVWSDLTDGCQGCLIEQAADPVVFDPDYNTLILFEEKLEEIDKLSRIPENIESFTKSFKKVVALCPLINSTYSKFMSALKEGDYHAAEFQENNVVVMLSIMEEQILILHSSILLLENSINEQIDELDFDSLHEGINSIRDTSEFQSYLDQKIEEGYSQELINRALAVIDNKQYKTVLQSQTDITRSIYYTALSLYASSLNVVRKIERISILSEIDLLKELFDEDLIDEEEYNERYEKAEKEQWYLLRDLDFIEPVILNKLKDIGIKDSKTFLEKCSTRYRRKKLTTLLGIEKERILELANQIDLIRVSNLDPEHAVILVSIGVDTVIELSKRNPDNLYKAITEEMEELQLNVIISKQQVIKWINTTSSLKRRLKY